MIFSKKTLAAMVAVVAIAGMTSCSSDSKNSSGSSSAASTSSVASTAESIKSTESTATDASASEDVSSDADAVTIDANSVEIDSMEGNAVGTPIDDTDSTANAVENVEENIGEGINSGLETGVSSSLEVQDKHDFSELCKIEITSDQLPILTLKSNFGVSGSEAHSDEDNFSGEASVTWGQSYEQGYTLQIDKDFQLIKNDDGSFVIQGIGNFEGYSYSVSA